MPCLKKKKTTNLQKVCKGETGVDGDEDWEIYKKAAWNLQLQLWWLPLFLWLKCSPLETHRITTFSLISHITPSRNSHHSAISWSCPLIRYACSSVWPVGQHAGWYASTHQTAPLSLILFLPLVLLLQSSTYLWTNLCNWAQEKADLFSIAFCIICTAYLTAKSDHFSVQHVCFHWHAWRAGNLMTLVKDGLLKEWSSWKETSEYEPSRKAIRATDSRGQEQEKSQLLTFKSASTYIGRE